MNEELQQKRKQISGTILVIGSVFDQLKRVTGKKGWSTQQSMKILYCDPPLTSSS